jgi:hypothetical protein
MGTLIAILVVAAVIGAVVWNKHTASAAMEGVDFHVAAPPAAVAAAIDNAHNAGAAAKLKGFALGIRVTGGGSTFRYESKIGDVGRIDLAPQGDGTRVRAATEVLYVGAHPRTISQQSSLSGVSSRLSHMIYTVIGITPNAGKMKRFQLGLERKITRRLVKVLT